MTPEGDLKKRVIELLVRQGYLVIKLNSGGKHNIPCSLWTCQEVETFQNGGVFDLLTIGTEIVHRITYRARETRYVWIDTKATRKPSPAQLEFKKAVEARGGACLFVKSLEELMEGLAR